MAIPLTPKEERYLKSRARPGQKRTVAYATKIKGKNYGLPAKGETTLLAGFCPCLSCNHKVMLSCEETDCQCCSGTCT